MLSKKWLSVPYRFQRFFEHCFSFVLSRRRSNCCHQQNAISVRLIGADCLGGGIFTLVSSGYRVAWTICSRGSSNSVVPSFLFAFFSSTLKIVVFSFERSPLTLSLWLFHSGVVRRRIRLFVAIASVVNCPLSNGLLKDSQPNKANLTSTLKSS